MCRTATSALATLLSILFQTLQKLTGIYKAQIPRNARRNQPRKPGIGGLVRMTESAFPREPWL
jgi:hypothetical protein